MGAEIRPALENGHRSGPEVTERTPNVLPVVGLLAFVEGTAYNADSSLL